jgi:hypothetical protein
MRRTKQRQLHPMNTKSSSSSEGSKNVQKTISEAISLLEVKNKI